MILGCLKCDAHASDAGDAFVYFGGSSMNNVVDVNLVLPEAGDIYDSFGGSVSDAGDVNNDGYADVIVGCEYCEVSGANAGDAFIYLGSASMSNVADLNLENPEADETNDHFGHSVSSAGDANGDGYDDVIVGCLICDAHTDSGGDAFVYFGGASMNALVDVDLASPEPAFVDEYFGWTVSAAGDVNNDGRDDVVVGCHTCDGNGSDAGGAFVYR